VTTKPADLPATRPAKSPPRRELAIAYAASLLPEPDAPKFVLFAQGRSGSTLFGELLGSHPEVRFDDEILRGTVANPLRYVTGMRRRPRARHGAYGFHVKVYQLSDAQGVVDQHAWLRECVDRGWKIFYLHRRNFIRQALSNATRQRMAVPHFREGDGLARPQVDVDPDLLLRYVEYRDRTGQWERAALEGIPHTVFEYEADLAESSSWDATAARAFAYLGVQPRPVDTSLRRINSGPISELVVNYNEVTRAFAATPYKALLED
jgi:LPS sulfotransferase NodH